MRSHKNKSMESGTNSSGTAMISLIHPVQDACNEPQIARDVLYNNESKNELIATFNESSMVATCRADTQQNVNINTLNSYNATTIGSQDEVAKHRIQSKIQKDAQDASTPRLTTQHSTSIHKQATPSIFKRSNPGTPTSQSTVQNKVNEAIIKVLANE